MCIRDRFNYSHTFTNEGSCQSIDYVGLVGPAGFFASIEILWGLFPKIVFRSSLLFNYSHTFTNEGSCQSIDYVGLVGPAGFFASLCGKKINKISNRSIR